MVARPSPDAPARLQALHLAVNLLENCGRAPGLLDALGGAAVVRALLELVKQGRGGGGGGGGGGARDASKLGDLALEALAILARHDMVAGRPSCVAAQAQAAAVVADILRDACAAGADGGAAARRRGRADLRLRSLSRIISAICCSRRDAAQQRRWVQQLAGRGAAQLLLRLLERPLAPPLAEDLRAACAAAVLGLVFASSPARHLEHVQLSNPTDVFGWAPQVALPRSGAAAAFAAAAQAKQTVRAALEHLVSTGRVRCGHALDLAVAFPPALPHLAAAPGLLAAAAEAATSMGPDAPGAMQLLYRLATLVEQLPFPAYAAANVAAGNRNGSPPTNMVPNHTAPCPAAYRPPDRSAAFKVVMVPLRALAGQTLDAWAQPDSQAALAVT